MRGLPLRLGNLVGILWPVLAVRANVGILHRAQVNTFPPKIGQVAPLPVAAENATSCAPPCFVDPERQKDPPRTEPGMLIV